MTDEREFMRLAIEEAKKCVNESGRVNPRVGAVLVKDGRVIASAHRGELAPGEHAEFTLLERKIAPTYSAAGHVLFTTLEPCVVRNAPKVPCASRIAERKISRVVIGMLDPNPNIRGKGQLQLRGANVETALFDHEHMTLVEELNRDFMRAQHGADTAIPMDSGALERNRSRSMQDWYLAINRVYWNRNFHLDSAAIFAHLVEVISGLGLLASGKRKAGVDPDAYVSKAVAWWLALCGKLGVANVENLVWDKFPGVCPYCQHPKHDPDECAEKKSAHRGPPWDVLAEFGRRNRRPSRLGEWQAMFSTIYPAQQTEDYGATFARLAEELGELSEAVRVFSAEPGYLLSEAADVFAWLMHFQNIIDLKRGTAKAERGRLLEATMCNAYPDGCRDCGQRICACPPILHSTIGRIAHEVPPALASFEPGGRFITADRASRLFQGSN